MDDAIKQAELRGYSRGYQAGRKRAETDAERAAERRERERAEGLFRQQVFCAALHGTMVSGGWRTGEKKWGNSSDYVRGCKNIANEAVKQFRGEIVA